METLSFSSDLAYEFLPANEEFFEIDQVLNEL